MHPFQECMLPAVACLRSLLMVVSACLTWLTVWHFSRKPFPLFHSWFFLLISLTLFSSMAVASTDATRQLLQQLWSWANDASSNNTNNAAAQQQTPPDQDTPSSFSLRKICRQVFAVLVVLLFLAASLVLNAGIVVVDILLIKHWWQWRAARNTPAEDALRGRLMRARHESLEASVLHALLFGLPCVPVKTTQMMMSGYSAIPIASAGLSAAMGLYTLIRFCCQPYMAPGAWSRRHRKLGIPCMVMYLVGHYLWRFASNQWLIIKFGGGAPSSFVYMGQASAVLLVVVLRSRAGREQFMQTYQANKLPVAFCTVLPLFMAFDITALFEGLKCRHTAKRPNWLHQLLLSRGIIPLLTWRLLEGLIGYVFIMTLRVVPPCTQPPKNIGALTAACADIPSQKAVWLPRCWNCAGFDLIAAVVPLVGIMWASVGFILLLLLPGYLGTYFVLPRSSSAAKLPSHNNPSISCFGFSGKNGPWQGFAKPPAAAISALGGCLTGLARKLSLSLNALKASMSSAASGSSTSNGILVPWYVHAEFAATVVLIFAADVVVFNCHLWVKLAVLGAAIFFYVGLHLSYLAGWKHA